MAKSRFTQAQILSALQKVKDGTTVTEVCCDHRISNQTFYAWRRKFETAPAAAAPSKPEIAPELITPLSVQRVERVVSP